MNKKINISEIFNESVYIDCIVNKNNKNKNRKLNSILLGRDDKNNLCSFYEYILEDGSIEFDKVILNDSKLGKAFKDE